jgi:predicted XRE-type DNA-binding protein
VKANSRRSDDTARRHITPADGNVFVDLGFPPAQAAEMLRDADARIEKAKKLKDEAAQRLADWIKAQNMSQQHAAVILAVSRPRVSDLVNLKTAKFSLDCLVSLLLRIGQDVELAFTTPIRNSSGRRQRVSRRAVA